LEENAITLQQGVENVNRVMKAVSQGDLSRKLKTENSDEVNALNLSINEALSI